VAPDAQVRRRGVAELSAPAAGSGQPQWLDAAGRRIRYLVQGEGGDAVVMVHGFGGRLENWSANQRSLASDGRTVVAFDLPGHGESSTEVGSGSLDDLATVALTVVDALRIDRAHLVGHSMGAALCLVLADREPDRVRSLSLVGPAGIGQRINADFIRGYIGARGRDEVAPLLRLLYADPRCVTDDLVESVVEYKRREGVAEALTRIASSRYAGTPTGRPLREVAGSVPTLLIWGAEDAVVPPPAPGALANPGVELHVLPARGHMVQEEAAEEVNRLIEAFLRR
jgi:pyruvate dehydrogenase E2 component (dihydrolipoamide acetyltransferase)